MKLPELKGKKIGDINLSSEEVGALEKYEDQLKGIIQEEFKSESDSSIDIVPA